MKRWMLPVVVSLMSLMPVATEASSDQSAPRKGFGSTAIAQLAAPAPSQGPMDKAWDLIRTARRSAANGQSAQATASLIQAEQTAGLLSNSTTLDQLLGMIAAEHAKLGNYDRAIATTRRMSYTSLPPQGCCIPLRTEAEIAIAQAYLQAQQVNQAQQFAASIQSSSSRQQVIVPIVAHLANQGQFTEAIAFSKQVGDQADRARYAILKGYINGDRLTEALAFTKTITDPSEQSSLLRTLSQWAWRSGKPDLSYQMANQIQEPRDKVQALTEAAFAYATAGQQQQAVRVLIQAYQQAQKLPDQLSLAHWAGNFAQIGAFDLAVDLANNLEGYEKANARVTIARAYANSGQYAKAIARAQQVQDGELQPFGDMPDLKVEAIHQIVKQAAKAGQYDLALQAANSLTQGRYRVTALRAIAQQYRADEQPQKASAILNQAVAAARTVDQITIFYDRNTAFRVSNAGLWVEIAQDYLALNQPDRVIAVLDEALEPARTLKEANANSVRQQVQYLSAIAKLYAQLQQPDRALAAAESAFNLTSQFPGSEWSSSFPDGLVPVLADVAQIFYTAGADKQAYEMLRNLRTLTTSLTGQQQLWGMEAIAKAYAAMGAGQQVQETVETALKLGQALDPAQQDWLTDRLAVAAATSDPAYAMQIAQTKLDRAGQIPTLAQMAVNYHAAGQTPQAQAVVVRLQQVAETIPGDRDREQILSEVVRNYLVPQGDRHLPISRLLQAGQVNADIQAPNLKAYNWFRIAQAYAFQGEAGRASETMGFALEVAKTLPDAFERRDLLWQLFEEALQAEEHSLAAQIATGFEETTYRTTALQRIQRRL